MLQIGFWKVIQSHIRWSSGSSCLSNTVHVWHTIFLHTDQDVFKVPSWFLAMMPGCSPGCKLVFQLDFFQNRQIFRVSLEKQVEYFIWGRGNINLSHSEVICGPLKDPVWGSPEGGLRREDTWQRRNWRRRVTDHRKTVIKSGNKG